MVGVGSVSKVNDLPTSGHLPELLVSDINCFLLRGSLAQIHSSWLLLTCEYLFLLVLAVVCRWCDWVGILIASLP